MILTFSRSLKLARPCLNYFEEKQLQIVASSATTLHKPLMLTFTALHQSRLQMKLAALLQLKCKQDKADTFSFIYVTYFFEF